jgi:formate-dependent nitrite reductase membrane component NrfD
MTKNLHAAAGLLGGLTILLFFSSTLAVEASGAHDAIAQAKGLIVWPGLLVLVPLLALTGLTGRKLAGAHPTGLAAAKLARMKWIAGNGLCVLVPCALTLNAWAQQGRLDRPFLIVQGLELVAGLVNLVLIGLNLADGVKLARSRRSAGAPVSLRSGS